MEIINYDACPPYELAVWQDGKVANDPGAVKWGGKNPPPAIGAKVHVRINNCGDGIVAGYYVEGGWLGLWVDLLDPPAWHVKQNNGNPRGGVFGPEIDGG